MKEFCKHGHAFTDENTYIYKKYRICRICRKKRNLLWINKSDKNYIQHILGKSKWIKNNKHKILAQQFLNKAVRNKFIVRPKFCSKCHSIGRIEAHHKNYHKPLSVIWLCIKCHKNVHLPV